VEQRPDWKYYPDIFLGDRDVVAKKDKSRYPTFRPRFAFGTFQTRSRI
jgi:hypothetical protein